MKYMVALLFICLIPACSLFQTKVGPQIAKAVAHYCVEPPEVRALLRAEVAEATKPNRIVVECAVDK